MTEYKKISFRIDDETHDRILKLAKNQYLSVSAYIRKCIDLQLQKEDNSNE